MKWAWIILGIFVGIVLACELLIPQPPPEIVKEISGKIVFIEYDWIPVGFGSGIGGTHFYFEDGTELMVKGDYNLITGGNYTIRYLDNNTKYDKILEIMGGT